MPKVGASLADVSTEFVPVDPDMYHCTIERPEFKEADDGRITVTVNNKIVTGEESGVENAGRTVRDMISMHKRDGEPNEFGAIQLKRYAEAAIPESEDWDEGRWNDFDTDELAGREVLLAVTIETYEEDLPGGRKEERKTNRIKRVLPV